MQCCYVTRTDLINRAGVAPRAGGGRDGAGAAVQIDSFDVAMNSGWLGMHSGWILFTLAAWTHSAIPQVDGNKGN